MGDGQIHCGDKEPESNCNKIITVDYDLIPATKRCAGPCKEHYPATTDFFYSNMSRSDGLDSKCKTCNKILGREKNKARKDICE